MNIRKLTFVVLAALSAMTCVMADTRTFGTGEKLYFKRNPSDWSWFGSDLGTGNHVFAYFFNGGSYAWSNEATVFKGSILQVTVPAGTWTNVIFTRQSGTSPNWSNVYSGNQSEDIPLTIRSNYIHNFRQKDTSGEGWHWVSTKVAPTPESTSIACHDASHSVTCEHINVCQQSIDAGDLFSLMPVWKSDKSDYNYVDPHVWLKWDASHNTWLPISDDWSDYTEVLENTDHVYYYLWTGTLATERIIHLNRVPCAVTCNITSFEYVKTPVNVNDSTFALEGSVAFTQAAGKLIITYGDSVLEIASPESPQVFSLKGLKADGTTDHLIAKFEDDGSCKADSVVTAPEPTSGIVEYVSTDAAHYSPAQVTYIHGTDVTLTPSVLVTDSFAWTDTKGAIKKSSHAGGDNRYTLPGFGHDTTLVLYYTEFNEPPIVDDNMMGNGNYENTTSADEDKVTSQYVATSDYNYTGVWGGLNSNHDVYDNGYKNQNGLFGITNNANTFWKRMSHITPKEGAYMAVFDGDDDEKVAWRASTAGNPHLTLTKGTTYMFSFWVANVNNYGEMVNQGNKNSAILQFKIDYVDTDGNPHSAYLGEEIALNDYMDNLWHQNSSTFTSDYDADAVTISVVDKNDAGISIGNDFALDDIRFRAVSIQSGTVRTREQFTIEYVEPKTNPVNLQVEWVTKPACGKDTCTMRVSFRYPNITMHDIKLTLIDLNTSNSYGTLVDNATLAKTPIAGNPDSTDYVAYFTSGTYAGATNNDKVKADAATHNFKAQLIVRDAKDIDHGGYTNATLDAIAIPALTITKADIASPSCSGTTYNLSVDVKYTAQSGTTLRYYIDDVSKATRSIDYNVTERSLANVEIFGLTADGKEHTLKVTTGHILDCIATQVFTAPKANTITSFGVEPNQPDCDVDTYSLRATWEIAKQEGGEYDALMIKVGTADPYEITITAANASGENAYFDIPITYNVGDEHPTIKAYMKERGASCYETGSYTDPTTPRMTIGEPTFEDIDCNKATFDLVVPVTYTYQHGKMWAWIDDKTSEKIEITASGNCKTGVGYEGYLAEATSSRTTYIVFDNVTLTGDHKVSVECDGEHSCHRTKALGTAKDFTAPVLPSVDRVFKSYSTPDCNVPYTTLTFDLKYANQPAGTIEMWVDDDKTTGHMITLASASGGYTPEAALKTIENQKITFVPADSLETHILHIKSGSCDETFTLPQVPFMPKIEDVSVSWPATLACGESSTYEATVTVTTSNYRNATLCVSLNGGTPQEKSPNSGSQTFTFSGLNADGGDNTVKAWFKCAGESCNQTKAFTSPTLPLAELVTPVSMPTVAACDAPTFDLTFDLEYTYQDGELQVWVDDDKKGYATFAASETDGEGKYIKLNKSEQTKTITLTGLPSDGGTTHKLYYKFDKSGYCNNTASPLILPTFPRSPTITDVAVSGIPAKVADCTVETYDATVTVQYQYTSVEKIMICYTDKDGVSKTHGPIALTGSPQAIVLDDLLNDIGKGSKNLQVYFRSGSEDLSCKHDAPYTAPSNSSINSEYDVTVTNTSSCGEHKYNLSGTVTYVGDATGDMHIVFKVGDAIIKDSVIARVNCSSSGTAFTMTGLTTDVTGHSLIAYFEDQPKCTAASRPFDAPDVCGFDAPVANMSYSAPACGEITTTLTFDLNYTYQNGDKLQVWVDGESKKEVSFEANANNEKTITGIEITGVSADGAPHTLHVEFVNGRCAAKTFTTSAAPFNPKPVVEIASISNQCDYESSTTVTYTTTYATTYNYYIVGKTELLATAKTASASGSFALDISTLDADTYTLKMVVNSSTCVSDTVSKTFTVYPKPEIKITGLDNQCDYKTETPVSYTTSSATTYNYYIVGRTELLETAKAASPSGSFSLDISTLNAGTYTLKMVANSSTCVSDTVSETFTVYPKPEVKITGIENQCDYETETTVSYTAADAAMYNYYIVGKTSLLATAEAASASGSFTLDISSLDAGTYMLKMVANSDYCVSDTVSKTFTVYPKPVVKITGIENRCDYESGTAVSYTTSDAATYNYYIVGKTGLLATAETASASGSFTLDISGLDAGTYTLKMVANSANCVSDTVSETFIVYPKPVVKITGIENQCDHLTETTVTYTTSAATTYNYYIVGKTELLATAETAFTSGSFTLDISSLNAGTYTLKMVANSDHCVSDTVTKTFTIYSEPTIVITEIDNQCDYATSIKVYYTTTGAETYKYRIVGYPLSDAKPATASGSFTLDISSLDAGNYTLRIVANSGTCTCDSVDASFVVYPEPKISATVDNQCDYVTSTTVAFQATDATTYNYYVPGKTQLLPAAKDVPASGEGTFTLDISTYDAGVYNLKVVANSTTCKSDTATVPFTIYPKPDVKITGINNKCDNETATTVTYTSSNATTYNYYIVGKTGLLETAPSASASGSFTLDISSLVAGTYTLKMVANSTDCKSDTIEKTFEIYPLPTFTFKEGEAHDCYPSTSISVGYTSANAKTYSYTLTKEGAGSPARTVADQSATTDGTLVLNTTGLTAGIYELEVTAKSEHDCELVAPVTKVVTIYAQPTISITSVENHCEGSAEIEVNYTSTDATHYTYEVVGTTLTGNGDAEASGSFKIDISSLEDGDYTLRMHVTAAHLPLTCDGTTDEENFTIWAVPEVSFVTPTPIKEGVANVTVTLELEKAEMYDWRFMNGATELESGTDVSASTTTITLTTGLLTEGTYTLYVVPKTSHCTGEEQDVHVVVNNKPTINFTDPDTVCAGTSTLSVEYSTSPDATDLYYTIMQGTTTVVAEQHVDLTTATSPLAVNISGLPYGDYTLTGYVRSSLESGDNSPVDFTLLAVPTINTVTQDVTFIGCEETYEATIKVNIFNAAGRKIYAKYSDDGEHTAHVETSVGDETATITLTGLTHTDLSGKHQVHVYVDGFEGCGVTAEYDEPKLMTITEGFEVTPLPKSCGDEKFTLTGKVVANCNVGKIVVEYDDTYKAEVDASTSGTDFTIADIPAGGSVTQLKAYFQGKTCGVVESAVFAEPTKPEASISFTPIVPPLCDVTTFDLEFTLAYIYQGEGTLTVWVDENHKNTYKSSENKYQALDKTPQQLVDKIVGLPADGRTGQKLFYRFDAANSCEGSIDLTTFPQTPLITGVTVTDVPSYVPGLSGEYHPTVTVTYEQAVGEKIVLEYFDKNDQPQYAYSASPVSGNGTCVFNEATGLTFDDITKGDRVVHAYFEDSDCKTGGTHDASYTAPTNSSVKFETLELVNTSLCEQLRYDLKGTVSFVGSADGDLIVEFDAAHRDTIAEAECVTGQLIPFEIKNVGVSIPDEGMKLKAWFENISGNPSYSAEVYEPVIPTIKVENAEYQQPACNVTTTSLTFDLLYTRQQGNLHLYLTEAGNEVECTDYTITAGDPLSFSDTEQQVTIVIGQLTANLSDRKLRVWFEDTNSCNKTFELPTAPFSPKVTSTKAEIKDVACNVDTYTLDVTFTVENSQSKDATLLFRGGTPVTVSTLDGTTYNYSFQVTRSYDDKTDDYVELYFDDNDAACNGYEQITYTETPKPDISLTLKSEEDATTCNQPTYLLHGQLDYTYLDEQPQIKLDNEAYKPIAVDKLQTEGKSFDLADLDIQVPADGREHHLYIQPNGWTNACPIDMPFNALLQPYVTGATLVAGSVPEYLSCDKTYAAEVTVDYNHAYGKTVTVAYTDNEGILRSAVSETISDEGEGQITVTLPASGDTGAATAIMVYVDDENCAYSGYSFAQPTLNSITPNFEVSTSANPCGVVDYAVTGTVTFNNAAGLGELVVKFDDSHPAVISSLTATSANFRIEHMTSEGSALQLEAYFSQAASCSVLSKPFASPVVPKLEADVTGVDTVFTCGDKTYKVYVSITSENQTGTCVVLDSISGGASRTMLTYEGTYNGTDAFTIVRPAVQETHYVVVRYAATGCEVVVSKPLDINAYTKPKPLISLNAIDRLCNSEAELNLPFVITQGDIDEATITLTDSKGKTVLSNAALVINDSKDTLSYVMAEQFNAGNYTVSVEARDTLDCVTTATLPIELAEDGVVFSKWTDVLLVDNTLGLYTAYQWYENGQPLPGKNEQVLYIPEGMNGTYTCLLTTADGQIFTCEYAFADIPRSADNQQSANHITVLPNRVKAGGVVTVQQSEQETLRLILLSTTGQRVAEYTQTESTKLVDVPGVQGIYLLRVASESDVQTVKIVVY